MRVKLPIPKYLQILAWLWALPYTLIGLFFAITEGYPDTKVQHNLLRVYQIHGLLARKLEKQGSVAITFGYIILFRGNVEPTILGHELVHVMQYSVLGPLFGLVYLGGWLYAKLLKKDPLYNNILEKMAYSKQEEFARKYIS